MTPRTQSFLNYIYNKVFIDIYSINNPLITNTLLWKTQLPPSCCRVRRSVALYSVDKEFWKLRLCSSVHPHCSLSFMTHQYQLKDHNSVIGCHVIHFWFEHLLTHNSLGSSFTNHINDYVMTIWLAKTLAEDSDNTKLSTNNNSCLTCRRRK